MKKNRLLQRVRADKKDKKSTPTIILSLSVVCQKKSKKPQKYWEKRI